MIDNFKVKQGILRTHDQPSRTLAALTMQWALLTSSCCSSHFFREARCLKGKQSKVERTGLWFQNLATQVPSKINGIQGENRIYPALTTGFGALPQFRLNICCDLSHHWLLAGEPHAISNFRHHVDKESLSARWISVTIITWQSTNGHGKPEATGTGWCGRGRFANLIFYGIRCWSWSWLKVCTFIVENMGPMNRQRHMVLECDVKIRLVIRNETTSTSTPGIYNGAANGEHLGMARNNVTNHVIILHVQILMEHPSFLGSAQKKAVH